MRAIRVKQAWTSRNARRVDMTWNGSVETIIALSAHSRASECLSFCWSLLGHHIPKAGGRAGTQSTEDGLKPPPQHARGRAGVVGLLTFGGAVSPRAQQSWRRAPAHTGRLASRRARPFRAGPLGASSRDCCLDRAARARRGRMMKIVMAVAHPLPLRDTALSSSSATHSTTLIRVFYFSFPSNSSCVVLR